MWWILWLVLGCGVAFLAGAMIRFGNPWGENEDNYMMGDHDPDEGDRS